MAVRTALMADPDRGVVVVDRGKLVGFITSIDLVSVSGRPNLE